MPWFVSLPPLPTILGSSRIGEWGSLMSLRDEETDKKAGKMVEKVHESVFFWH